MTSHSSPGNAVSKNPGPWPVGVAATAHFAAATPNCRFIEFLPPSVAESALRRELVHDELQISDGKMRYMDLAKSIGLMSPQESWHISYRTHITDILNLLGATQRQAGNADAEFGPLEFERIVTAEAAASGAPDPARPEPPRS